MRVLLLLFLVMPIIEMWLLIKVGGVIGALPTIGLVLLTACIGLGLLRIQGTSALMSARQKLAANEIPAREMADGLFFAIGGALLLTPGFVTDAIGFACLTPGVRTIIIHFFAKHVIQSMNMRTFNHARTHAQKESQIIDGDFKREPDNREN